MENADKEFILKHCRDFCDGYPYVFTKDFGLDVVIPNHPEYVVKPPIDYTVRLDITSWRGISINAIHYYGEIVAMGPYLSKTDEHGDSLCVGGFICDEWGAMSRNDRKFVNEDYRIEVVRPLSQNEIDEDPERWRGYIEGCSVNSFCSLDDVISISKKIIRARFPGWTMEINDTTI